MSQYSAKQIASYLIEKSDSCPENDLTNLKLQKILYFAQAEYYQKYHEPLFVDAIEAWELGPVISSIYQWVKGCGSYPIAAFDVEINYDGLTGEILKFLDEIWDKYSKYSASFLVTRTHDPSGPWSEVYKGSASKVIDLSKLETVKL